MALRDLPRIPLWQIFALLAVLGLVGSVLTVVGAGRPPSSALELILTFVPPVIFALVSVWLWVRARRRAALEAAPPSEGAEPAGPSEG